MEIETLAKLIAAFKEEERDVNQLDIEMAVLRAQREKAAENSGKLAMQIWRELGSPKGETEVAYPTSEAGHIELLTIAKRSDWVYIGSKLILKLDA